MSSAPAPFTLNGSVCTDLVFNSDTFPMWFINSTADLDPNNTLWSNHFASAGGSGDWGNLLALDPEVDYSPPIVFETGAEQGNAFCRAIYRKNNLADLNVDSICCQQFALEDGEDTMTMAFITTATTVDENVGTVITMPGQDENGNDITQNVQYGAEILTEFEDQTMEEYIAWLEEFEEEEEGHASILSLGWASIAASALYMLQ